MNRFLAVLLWAALGTGVINAEAGQWRLTGGGTFSGDEQWQEGDGGVAVGAGAAVNGAPGLREYAHIFAPGAKEDAIEGHAAQEQR